MLKSLFIVILALGVNATDSRAGILLAVLTACSCVVHLVKRRPRRYNITTTRTFGVSIPQGHWRRSMAANRTLQW